MGAIALEGFWLLAAFVTVYLVGVFSAQWAKDKISGVPSNLRKALSVTETAALKELSDARERLIAETVGLLAKGRAAAAAEVTQLRSRIHGDDEPAAPVVGIVSINPESNRPLT